MKQRVLDFGAKSAGQVGLDEQQLSALQQRAMRIAEAYGCEAGVQVADFMASDPAGALRLQVVVAMRAPQGTLLSRESNVVLITNEHAASVEQIVRDVAAKLSRRSAV